MTQSHVLYHSIAFDVRWSQQHATLVQATLTLTPATMQEVLTEV